MARVLVIEAEATIRTSLLVRLQHQGHLVCGSPNVARSMNRARQLQPDLIVLNLDQLLTQDWSMIRRLKTVSGTNSTLTLGLTTQLHAGDRLRASLSGLDEILLKPCELDKLVQSASTLLNNHVPIPANRPMFL